ncbi:solute carrier organic anion transporter family member 74D-like [Haemaphysalis longicornis]
MADKTTTFKPVPTSEAQQVDEDIDPDEIHPGYTCGVFNYRPQWMQRFAKTRYFLLCYIVYGIFQGASKAYLNGCISTIEKKFALSGKTFSTILIADNLSSPFASLIIGYYARKVSRPKLIVSGVWMSVLGCLLQALPYFVYGPGFVGGFQRQSGQQEGQAAPLHVGVRKEFCARTNRYASAPDLHEYQPATAIVAVCLLFIANFCNGFGGAAFYIAGTTYTDDNAKKINSIIYHSLIFSLRFLGPMLGYVVASVCLGIYESPFDNPNISKEHPGWIGAWWMGFLIWAVSLAIMSLPLAFFPKHIRNSNPLDNEHLEGKASVDSSSKTLKAKLINDLAGFRQSFARLCKNPVLMSKTAMVVFNFSGVSGYITMFPKYVEVHYRVSASNASLFTGPTKIFALMLGLFIGGLVVRFLKPKPRTIVLAEAATDFIEICFLAVGMTLSCSQWQLAGTTMDSDGRLSLVNNCNQNCGCSNRSFQPVCDVSEKATYFSPCAAGCTDEGNGTTHCSCLLGNTSFTGPGAAVKEGFCDFSCNGLYILVTLTSVSTLIAQLPKVGSMIVTLRCVHPADKGLAMGMMAAAFNLIAAIPYPLLYSALFDASCLLWDERGGHRGSCSFYNADKLRVAFHGVTIALLSLSMISNLVMSYYCKRVTNMYDDADAYDVGATETAPTREEDGSVPMDELDKSNPTTEMPGGGESRRPRLQRQQCIADTDL